MTRDELIAEMERKPDPQILIETFEQWAQNDRMGGGAELFRRDVADSIAAYLDAVDAQ